MLQEVINYNLKLLPSLQEGSQCNSQFYLHVQYLLPNLSTKLLTCIFSADDFKTASEGKGEGTVGVANPILRPTSEEIQSITKLQADINMGSVSVILSVGVAMCDHAHSIYSWYSNLKWERMTCWTSTCLP